MRTLSFLYTRVLFGVYVTCELKMLVNSIGPGVARVTIRGMKAALALVFVALVVTACGRAESGDSRRLQAEADRARAEADEALQAVDAMKADLEALRADLEADAGRLRRQRERMTGRLDSVRERLWGALSSLRDTIAGLRHDSSAAVSEAASALDEARSAAKDLAVLESRYDYHLRRDHGGG
jgi:hypothetical protein